MTLAPGTRLGPYEILAPLGAGGMGEVYRARDQRLGRDVAVKVLPERVGGDPEAAARFEREARAVAALSHPNILAIHDVGADAGIVYSVTELLEGRTLRQCLEDSSVPARKALDYAVQIARGLAAAHEKGVVHRDLKPENIFVTGDGQVKILDFGLARMAPISGSDLTASPTVAEGTRPGTVLGTMGYMSPEQVRGLQVDHRSDIFSFGAILYEMLSGQRAFRRETAADTMSAILREEPAALPAAAPEISPSLQRLVHHCLEKNAAERFQSARDLTFHLEAVGSSSTSSAGLMAPIQGAAASRTGRPGALILLALGAGIGVLAALLIGPFVSRGLKSQAPSAPPQFKYLSYAGVDAEPAASPDGRLIAYTSVRDGRSQIWLKQFPAGDEVALTSGPGDTNPRVSPDGAQVLFVRSEGAVDSLYRVPLVGGEPRKVLDNAYSGDWSPDGKRVVFLRNEAVSGGLDGVVGTADTAGLSSREIARVERVRLDYPRWSPDGRTIAVVERGGENAPNTLLLVDAEGKGMRPLTPPPPTGRLSSPAWVGSGSALVYAQAESFISTAGADQGSGRLVVQTIATGEAETKMWLPATPPVVDVLSAGTLVLGVSSVRQNLQEVALTGGALSARTADGPPRWVTRGASVDRQPTFSPDGQWVLFSSNRGGNLDLWKVSLQTGAIRRITEDPVNDWDPAFTPDGKSIIWSTNRSGHFEIWICAADGTGARQLSQDGLDAENPTATPDGQWVVYNSTNPAQSGIWKIHPDGTGATRLVPGSWSTPDVSPDGQYVAFRTGDRPRSLHVARIADGRMIGSPIETSGDLTGARPRWMPDGRSIVFTSADMAGNHGLLIQTFAPGQDTGTTRRPLRAFVPSELVESFGISPDGGRIVYSVAENLDSLMLAQGLTGIVPPVRTGR